MSSSWHSYASIFALGHRAIADLLTVPVIVEEKVDGSQFSWGVFDAYDADGNLEGEVIRVRSKGAIMLVDAPEKMFTEAVETVKRLAPQLQRNWTYRAEYLKKPKHNALCYDRIPVQHLIVFDINTDHEAFLGAEAKRAEAERLGLEVVPLLFEGTLAKIDEFRAFLDTTSCLGGQQIEGVVVKPAAYNLFGRDKKVLMGKFVSEAFKEVHSREWKSENPTGKDILTQLGDMYHSPARWQKAIQHLRERGEIEDSPRDIGKLFKEIPADIQKECEEEIKERLWKWAWPHVQRGAMHGFPEWYKDELLKKQFAVEEVG